MFRHGARFIYRWCIESSRNVLKVLGLECKEEPRPLGSFSHLGNFTLVKFYPWSSVTELYQKYIHIWRSWWCWEKIKLLFPPYGWMFDFLCPALRQETKKSFRWDSYCRRLPPCPMVIVLVPLNCSSWNSQFPHHRVPFNQEENWCPCSFQNLSIQACVLNFYIILLNIGS